MFNFQNSKYFEIPLLVDLSFSIEIQTLLSKIAQNEVSFGTPLDSLGLMDFSFSIEIQTSLSQITQNGVNFGTPLDSLGWP
jgi:hypothetical protein